MSSQPPTSQASSASAPPRGTRGGRSLAWLFGLLPVVLVAGVVAGYAVWGPDDADHGGLGAVADTAQPGPGRVVAGRDYYVFVKTIELYPEQADGGVWDRFEGSAPDIRYSLLWQGHVVFESDVRRDTLIGLWDPIQINLWESLPIVGDGTTELRAALNQGAIVNITADQTLTLNVWDQDPAGLGSDSAGQIVLNVADLLRGDNVLRLEKSDANAIKRVVLGTTDTAMPAQNLIDALAPAAANP